MTKLLTGAISGRNVAVLITGLFIGFFFGLILPRVVAARTERVAAYEEVAAQSAVREAAEIAFRLGVDSAEYGLAYETLPGMEKYDGPGFAQSMPIDTKDAWLSWMRTNRSDSPIFLEQRWKLAQDFVGSSELKRPEDVRAFLLAPREHFVRERNAGLEYADSWLPIGHGATITDPDVVAMMTTTLDIKPGERVLEIGTGSGYQSAILSYLSNEVYTIEIIKPLFVETDQLYRDWEKTYPSYGAINRKLGDGYYGWEKYAPFEKIIVTCAIDHIPPPLLQQLAINGIMVLPLGPPGRQYIMEIKKERQPDGTITLSRRDVYNGLRVSFIPFRDEAGTSYSTSNTR
ncbi:MAG: protein-L-isoaspartate O-methyltransferase [Spirochaetales bacterium]|jgi:protein-L-isoaspartate(D-aspartate) O-methyltransferase|nr:protein-L-isoaspartate O-methyltransferase [Spirochaetales bacterium]